MECVLRYGFLVWRIVRKKCLKHILHWVEVSSTCKDVDMRIGYFEETYRELENMLVFLGYENTAELVDSLMWCHHEPINGTFDVADFCTHERYVANRLFNVFVMLMFNIGNIKDIYTDDSIRMRMRKQRKSYSVNDLSAR